jgi:hypothetical protein
MSDLGTTKLDYLLNDVVGGDPVFQVISSLDDHPYPCMDIGLDIVHTDDDEFPNYYGCDFRKVRHAGYPILMLFFTGQSNYFPGLVCIKDIPLEKCPIYIFDLAGGCSQIKAVGNFRHYIETLLNHFLEYSGEIDDVDEIELNELKTWSRQGIEYLHEHFSTEIVFPEVEIEIPVEDQPDEPIKLKNEIDRND